MHRLIATTLACLLVASCDIRLDLTDGTPASPTGPTITNTNTNTSTNTNDRADTTPTPLPSDPGGGSGGAALPLPTYGEQVTRDVAAQNPALVTNSCQETTGELAWGFLDLVVRTLRIQDQRWGYLCKDANCTSFGRDVITYKATAADTGIWIVDVIGNHCPLPSERAEVRWGVLPFETTRRWSAVRK